MALASDSPVALDRRGGDPQVDDVLGEIAAAVTYLETLGERLRVGVVPPGELDATAIPPSTLIAVRRSCQRIARHSGRALAAMSPRRAAEVGAAAAQIREIELLRAQRRSR